MPTGSVSHRATPQPSSTAQASRPASTLERIEGRVESATDTGLRLSGRWYEWPRGWTGQRPAVGHVVELHYRTHRVIQAVQPANGSGTTPPAPSAPTGRRSSTSSSAPSSSRTARGTDAGQARTIERKIVEGAIESANERGVKLNGVWYNFSQFTPLADQVRLALVRGAAVRLTVENQRWIADAEIQEQNDAQATDMDNRDNVEEGYDERYV